MGARKFDRVLGFEKQLKLRSVSHARNVLRERAAKEVQSREPALTSSRSRAAQSKYARSSVTADTELLTGSGLAAFGGVFFTAEPAVCWTLRLVLTPRSITRALEKDPKRWVLAIVALDALLTITSMAETAAHHPMGATCGLYLLWPCSCSRRSLLLGPSWPRSSACCSSSCERGWSTGQGARSGARPDGSRFAPPTPGRPFRG